MTIITTDYKTKTFPDGKVFLLQSFSNWICFFLKKEVGQTSNLSDYYNLPATASNNSWIFAWLLPPAMAMSGLPPPRPSTIGANSLITLPACTSFVLLSNKDVDLVTNGCDKNKHIRVVFLFPVIRKGTKSTSIRYRYLASNVTVTIDFLNILEDIACGCSCGFFFQLSIFFLKLTKLFLKSSTL